LFHFYKRIKMGSSFSRAEDSDRKNGGSPKKRGSSSTSSQAESPCGDTKQTPLKPEKPTTPSKEHTTPGKDSNPEEKTPSKTEAPAMTVEPCTPPKPDEIIEAVSEAELASIEAATSARKSSKAGLGYDVVLSPAIKQGPRRTSPPTSPSVTEDDIARKLREAEERKQSLDQLRMDSLTAQLARIEITQQKKEELVAEKSSKAKEVMESKLHVAEEKRSAQLQEVKDKMTDHMGKIEKAQKDLEHQLELARAAAEATLCEKMDTYKKNRDEEMEEMLKKIQDHTDKVNMVRSNQEERLKPYVSELEQNIKEKLDRAKQAKERQDELLKTKLAEQNRRAELVRQNKERILAEGGVTEDCNQTNESA